jgi:8-hydroxy-5-deazaflavin:NADPH oxidoreductase
LPASSRRSRGEGGQSLQVHVIAGDPQAEGGWRVLFYSGDDPAAKAAVGALIERLGFFGIDLGSLALRARLVQFPGGPLPVHNLVRFG